MKISDMIGNQRGIGQRSVVPIRVQIKQVVSQLKDDEVLSVPEMAAILKVHRHLPLDHGPACAREGLARRICGRFFFGKPRALAALECAVTRSYENR